MGSLEKKKLSERSHQQINLTRLQTEACLMMARRFWQNSIYWSNSLTSRGKNLDKLDKPFLLERLGITTPTRCDEGLSNLFRSMRPQKNILTHAVARVAYFKKINRFGFNFCKYHPDVVEIVRGLPPDKRFFYRMIINRYASFKIWYIDSQHFDFVIAQRERHTNIELEFVVSHFQKSLAVLEPFTEPEPEKMGSLKTAPLKSLSSTSNEGRLGSLSLEKGESLLHQLEVIKPKQLSKKIPLFLTATSRPIFLRQNSITLKRLIFSLRGM